MAKRAVSFRGNTILISNAGIRDNVPLTPVPDFLVSYWYSSAAIRRSHAIISSYNGLTGASVFLVTHDYFQGQPGIADGYHLRLIVTDGDKQYFHAVSDTVIPHDGAGWRHVALTGDTSNYDLVNQRYAVAGSVQGVPIRWNPVLTFASQTPMPFGTQYYGNTWTVGGYVPMGVLAERLYLGWLSELWCHVGQADYMMILNAHRPSGFAYQNITGLGEVFAPLELGLEGESIFGASDLPVVYLRGDATTFTDNHGGGSSFHVPLGADDPTTAPSDPFDLWP